MNTPALKALVALAELNPNGMSLEQMAKSDLRICMPSRMTPENIEGVCAECAHPIFCDPGYSDGPKKICLDCALDIGRGENALSA
jgi:hypothetical protein